MGRKRTSNKKDINLYVDKDIIERLKKLELNASAIFTDAALKELKKYEKTTNEDKRHE